MVRVRQRFSLCTVNMKQEGDPLLSNQRFNEETAFLKEERR